MLASDQTLPELALALPRLDARALLRRAALPMLAGAVLVAVVVFAGGHVGALTDVLHRTLNVSPGWVVVALTAEAVSVASYILLLSLVAGRSSARIGALESAQITLAGTAATRLLPTAGAGGAALTLWTLRRAGMSARAASGTLLTFLVLLYSVFLGALVLAGALLSLGLVDASGPGALAAAPAAAAALAIAVALVLGLRSPADDDLAGGPEGRVRRGARLLADSVRRACRLLRHGDPRLLGAVGYWAFDAAVLWATLHAFGAAPALPVIVLAYFVGQVANTLPLPGSVSGGIAGVLIAFGVTPPVALAAVLAYRTVAVWLPVAPAAAALPGYRSTLRRWSEQDQAAA